MFDFESIWIIFVFTIAKIYNICISFDVHDVKIFLKNIQKKKTNIEILRYMNYRDYEKK